jgi:hypothetical protein
MAALAAIWRFLSVKYSRLSLGISSVAVLSRGLAFFIPCVACPSILGMFFGENPRFSGPFRGA